MSLILRQVIGYQQGRKASPLTAPKENPLLKKQLEQTQKDLNLILNKWKFGDAPLKSAQEFLNSFEPWINKQMEQKKELQDFLNEQGASNLNNLKETWKNTETDYLRRIEELKASKGDSEETEDLITERDEAIRDKKTLEQTNLALNNRLTLKQQEVGNKEKALEKLKKETSEKEISLNKKLTEKNSLITTLKSDLTDYKKQHQELREKYTKQSKLLDTEQLECKKLEEEVEKLKAEIEQLKK